MAFIIIFLTILNLHAGDVLQEFNVVYIGDSLRVDAQNIKKVAVSNKRVIRVSKEDKTLIINAKSRGNATLHIWYKGTQDAKRYSFSVMSTVVHKKVAAVQEALKNIQGIKVSSAGENVYITGTVAKKDDIELIKKIVASNKEVMNYVKMSGAIQQDEYKKLTDVLLDMGLYDIEIKDTGTILFVNASARTKKQIENAEHYLKINYPQGKFDLKVIPYQIDIDVKIVEISNSMGRQMGLELPGEFNLTRHTVLSSIEVDSILHLSESRGSAKLLSNPSLSANDGENASFHAGGAIPVKLTSRYSSNLEWKNYGVILNFTPKVVNEDTVELSISSEFSNIDGETSTKDAPGFLIREVKTVVTMDSGKSVVISGLVNKSTTKANKGLPGVVEIPILSELFSSNEVNNEDSELAIIVTASIRFRCEEFFIDKKLEALLVETLSDES